MVHPTQPNRLRVATLQYFIRPAVSLNFGQAAILTPSDLPFARDGIFAEGNANEEAVVTGELDLETIEETRSFGRVLPLGDSARTQEVIATPEVVTL